MLDHLDDLACDFWAVYGIRDMLALPGPVFFKMATRVSAYPSVMRERLLAKQNDTTQPATQPAAAEPAPSRAPARSPSGQLPPPLDTGTPGSYRQGDTTFVPGTKQSIRSNPELAGLFSFGTGT